MTEQKIKTSLRQKLLKVTEIIIVFLFTIFIGTFMAFYYDELGPVISTILVIVFVVLFLPKFLRRNFGTDKEEYQNIEVIGSPDYQNKIGSFIWTRTDNNGLFAYREFVTGSFRSAKKQLEGRIFYIDFKAKCLIAVVQILHIISLPLIFIYIRKIKEPIMAIFVIVIASIFFIKSYDKTRNFIIRKFKKNNLIKLIKI